MTVILGGVVAVVWQVLMVVVALAPIALVSWLITRKVRRRSKR